MTVGENLINLQPQNSQLLKQKPRGSEARVFCEGSIDVFFLQGSDKPFVLRASWSCNIDFNGACKMVAD